MQKFAVYRIFGEEENLLPTSREDRSTVMGEDQGRLPFTSSVPPPQQSSEQVDPPPHPPAFDPSRMIGIIKRKALIKELAAAYHTECLAYCQELLELQKKREEPFLDAKTSEDVRKETMKPPKRLKKTR
ncbi:uncharacterized protein LOC110819676 [Carica papaya]|uniref:uncharacterized protein LOC110819676 n=1 Tax=Carica papaya TaxID=3649 RepID=UPI000B8CE1AC|nr:uncharacterized protein LOC110819676 [Carica papaya]